jgi:hypothetical protein
VVLAVDVSMEKADDLTNHIHSISKATGPINCPSAWALRT